ncbi:Uncharacterised protein [Edwardsiella tarda]|nr:Uncharacterised protein [Edwardsiella tarda]
MTVYHPDVIEIDQEFGIPGETRKVPAMINPMTGAVYAADPGFGINPGKVAWQPELDKYATPAARQYITATLTGPDFVRGYTLAQAGTLDSEQRYPVAMLAQPVEGSRVVHVQGSTLTTMANADEPVTPAMFLLAQQRSSIQLKQSSMVAQFGIAWSGRANGGWLRCAPASY